MSSETEGEGTDVGRNSPDNVRERSVPTSPLAEQGSEAEERVPDSPNACDRCYKGHRKCCREGKYRPTKELPCDECKKKGHLCKFDRTKSKNPTKEKVKSPTPTRRQSQVRRNKVSSDSQDTSKTKLSNTRRVSPRTASTKVVILEPSGAPSRMEREQEHDETEVKDDEREAAEVLVSLKYDLR